jgi:hypothetical protein
MPWTANDAESHTHKATTSELKELWAKVANESLERNGDEGRAVREANAVVLDRHDPANRCDRLHESFTCGRGFDTAVRNSGAVA